MGRILRKWLGLRLFGRLGGLCWSMLAFRYPGGFSRGSIVFSL